MITVNLYYTGTNGSAKVFAEEMESSGIADAIDAHHASPMMSQLAALREKYDLHMKVERFVSEDFDGDEQFIRK